jgi:hypothetical protein
MHISESNFACLFAPMASQAFLTTVDPLMVVHWLSPSPPPSIPHLDNRTKADTFGLCAKTLFWASLAFLMSLQHLSDASDMSDFLRVSQNPPIHSLASQTIPTHSHCCFALSFAPSSDATYMSYAVHCTPFTSISFAPPLLKPKRQPLTVHRSVVNS